MSRVDVDGRELKLSNLDKVLYPEAGFTKAQVIDYYGQVANAMVPHLAGRAVTMVRWPDGVERGSFFEKRCPSHAPAWMHSAESQPGLRQCVLDDRPSLVWAANMAALELHTLQARVDEPDRPTAMVFDLDPGEPAGVLDCARVALELRDLLAELGLRGVVKTSGGKGLHVAVPLHSPATDTATKELALACGQLLQHRDPERVTVVMAKAQRRGKVFIDWSQNDRHKTTVCAYSLRGRARPTVSCPVSWDEVSEALTRDDPDAITFETATVLERIGALGDLYRPALEDVQELPALG